MKTFTTTEDRVVRLGEAWVVLGLPSRTGFDWVKKGILPRPLALGPRARGYRLSTLQKFLADREGAVS
jgi:predicted DNA-binding transcriptional regulator AlpA